MAHETIVYDRRVRLIEYAARIGNVAEACRVFGVSRKTYYEWLNKAEQYGLSALLPRDRRHAAPAERDEQRGGRGHLVRGHRSAHLGPRSLLRHLRVRGVDRSASGVAKVLVRHRLGTAKQRVAALASLTAAETGQLTAQALEGPFGFCLYAAAPGQVVAWTPSTSAGSRASGRSGSSPPVDVATRTAVVQLLVGDKTAAVAAPVPGPPHQDVAQARHQAVRGAH